MNKRNKIIISIVGITIVLLALLGITYAYYLTRIQGNTNTNSISITTADLSLTYGDGTTEILTSDTLLMPGEFEGTKDFTVTNNGNSSVTYGVILEDMINQLSRPQDMKMTLSCSSNKEDGCKGLDEMNLPSTNEFLVENTIDVGEKHTYELKLRYIEAGEDQSIDMGKSISGKVNIISSHDTVDMTGIVTGYEEGDYVKVGESKISYITSEGKYKVVGLNPNQYTINVYKSDGTLKGTKELTIKSGTTESISENEITITKDTRKITMNITAINQDTTITTGSTMLDKYNPFKTGTLAYAIVDSAKTESYELFTELEMKLADVDEDGIVTEQESNYVLEYALGLTIDVAPNIGKEFTYDGEVYKIGDLNDDGMFNSEDSLLLLQMVDEYEKYVKYESSLDFNTSSGETDKILSYVNDDYGTSYFYRGAVTNNYVLFNNMCFRIVRIEGDGSIKLTLAGEVSEGATDCSEVTDSSSILDSGTSVIYGYKTTTGLDSKTWTLADYESDTSGTSSISLKESLDEWFDGKFKSDGELTSVGLKIKDESLCLGGSFDYRYNDSTGALLDDAGLNTIYTNDNSYHWNYSAGNRRNITKEVDLTCGDSEDKITSKVGALTYDEVVLSGYSSGGSSNSNYLMENATNNAYWLLSLDNFGRSLESPDTFSGDYDSVMYVNASGGISIDYVDYPMAAARPVITLISGIEISSGNGTIDEPYVINVD